MAKKLLILGGTTQANELCHALEKYPEIHPILSLAGVTKKPHLPHIKTRIGGFGGVNGLRGWLKDNAIDMVIDATHPFATQMTNHSAQACTLSNIPALRYERPPWQQQPGDVWFPVTSIEQAAQELATNPRWCRKPQNVFLTTGRKLTRPFTCAPQHHYLLRSVDPPAKQDTPPHTTCLLMRGPFTEDIEREIFRKHHITILVTKNSGGEATYPKLKIAREMSIPVLMVGRPSSPPNMPQATQLKEVLAWIVTGKIPAQ